jgi:signal transduction histidine kinase
VDVAEVAVNGAWIKRWWPALVGLAGIAVVAMLIRLATSTDPAPLVVAIAAVAAFVILVGPVAFVATRRFADDTAPVRIVRRVLVVAVGIAVVGLVFAAGIEVGYRDVPGELVYKDVYENGRLAYRVPFREDSDSEAAVSVAALAIAVSGALAFVGLVVGPWMFLVVRTLARGLSRERAARARAEERASVAAHLHDSVLQTLTLMQKEVGDAGAVMRLARHAERDLRAWLYGANDRRGGDDLAGALAEVVADVEDRFGVAVELVTVGTCPVDDRTRAVVGAAREALTNAARHAQVRQVSVFAEVSDGEVLVLVRDRGRGFDQARDIGPNGHGIADSITGRMRRHSGTARIHTAVGAGTEVELRMPVGEPR